MKTKTVAQVAVLVLILGAAAFFAVRNSGSLGEDSDFTERKIAFLCQNAACQNGFEVRMEDLRRGAREWTGVSCPACGKSEVVSAQKCESCAKMTAADDLENLPKACAHCAASFVPGREVPPG